ncbi:unnamed protein product [Rhizophagus irregularis]|nr:unnamed protein product [Rhizophagus irregularis]CAB5372984.1 unnamed protein product [Rhizophagus irregularis]
MKEFLDRNKLKITPHSFTRSHRTNKTQENKENSSWIPNKIRGKRPTNVLGKNKLNVKRRKDDNDIIENTLKESTQI